MNDSGTTNGRVMDAVSWHSLPVTEVIVRLGTDAGRRLADHGPNALDEPPGTPWWRTFLRQFRELVIWILVVAAAIAATMGRIAEAKLMARVGEEFPLACPACGGDIRLIAFITEPGPIRKILTHLGEPLEPPPVSPARGPPTDWGELVQVHDDRDIFQASPQELPAIDIHSL
jgi:hypothetical protein